MADPQTPAENDAGRCGNEAPRLVNGPRVWCRLRADHAGWHRGDDGSEWSAETDTPVRVERLRVPTDRLLPNPGERLNIGVQHVDVEVVIESGLSTLGKHESFYGGDRITLREWNEQVFLHELLHVVLDRAGLTRTDDDPHLHNIISRVEVALWETGWRLSPCVLPPAGAECPSQCGRNDPCPDPWHDRRPIPPGGSNA